ncbi:MULTISPECIES: UvrD-helicase domain-containing protein [Paraburkholderia]|uniref:UvrD-helicase domain-containing protein n=1 Tax=Paraburkholderia TaxID=1822464 RepID=UPI0032186E43
MRYAHAFPSTARPPAGMPRNGQEWQQLYRGAAGVTSVSSVRQVIEASYDRVLIDEYQDCEELQHGIATALAGILPTIVLGDPMQGIFEFTGGSIRWEEHVLPSFPAALSLDQPRRWEGKNPELGAWIAQTRDRLIRGERFDLMDAPIKFQYAQDEFDMSPFFDGFDDRDGSVAAIHCWRPICNRLAKATRGAYQSIEEIAAARLLDFARDWDSAASGVDRVNALRALFTDCVHQRQLEEGEAEVPGDVALLEAIQRATQEVSSRGDAEAAKAVLSLSRKHSLWRVFRSELWRDAERAVAELAAGRAPTLSDAAVRVRQRLSSTGRAPQRRTISTPLLLKGLEFEHVIVPHATHFVDQRFAAAKLFYVAISRATRSLTITARDRYLQFPVPNL